jgi:mediator of RNA polymerase II transcription subunit 14
VSITCVDQLSPSGGSFDLRFSRCGQPAGTATYNPQSDAEPFFRNILKQGHGRLASSLHRLISLLRDTQPIAAELEDIRVEADQDGEHLDAFAKAAGWYRVLYGDLKHAIDWRLMREARVLILDASETLFRADRPAPAELREAGPTAESSAQEKSSSGGPPAKVPSPKTSSVVPDSSTPDTLSSMTTELTSLGLQPIPRFREIISDAVREVVESDPTVAGSRIAALEVGVVCDKGVVRAIGRALHRRVIRELKK